MTSKLYYGLALTEEEFVDACGEDFVFPKGSCIKSMKDWLDLCDIFHEIQMKYKIDTNIIQNLLRTYLFSKEMSYVDGINIPFGKSTTNFTIDKYGYSEYMDIPYKVDYDFCKHYMKTDFEYVTKGYLKMKEDHVSYDILGVKIGSLNYHYEGVLFFDIQKLQEVIESPKCKKFRKRIKAHPKLSRFTPKIIFLSSNDK